MNAYRLRSSCQLASPLRPACRLDVFESETKAPIAAVVHGDAAEDEWAQVRVHSQCFTGEALGSGRCDCAAQLESSLDLVARAPFGVLVYCFGHEGRGIGLGAKVDAYRLQDGGLDTFAANEALGLPADAREFGGAAAVLAALGVRQAVLHTRNPAKAAALAAIGIKVRCRPLDTGWSAANAAYLAAKLAHFAVGAVTN